MGRGNPERRGESQAEARKPGGRKESVQAQKASAVPSRNLPSQRVLRGEASYSRPLGAGESLAVWVLCCDAGPCLFPFSGVALRSPPLPLKPHLFSRVLCLARGVQLGFPREY